MLGLHMHFVGSVQHQYALNKVLFRFRQKRKLLDLIIQLQESAFGGKTSDGVKAKQYSIPISLQRNGQLS